MSSLEENVNQTRDFFQQLGATTGLLYTKEHQQLLDALDSEKLSMFIKGALSWSHLYRLGKTLEKYAMADDEEFKLSYELMMNLNRNLVEYLDSEFTK